MLSVMESLEATSLMPIGRFARLTGLSVKALRHYDELGLLRPAAVDAGTGYRSYSTAQVERAETIRLLRRLEVPLDEIAMLLEADDPARVRKVLLDHQRRTAVRSAQLKSVLQRLQPLLDGECYAAIATHDEWLVDESLRLLRERSLPPDRYEFQMLLGVRPELGDRLVADGHRLRIYVPYGRQWYEYSLRRLQENPKIAGYVAGDLGRSLFRRR